MASELRIGFLGAGKMASALAQGFVQAALVAPDQLSAADPVPAAREHFAQVCGSNATATNAEVVRWAQVVILAVKPDQIETVLRECRDEFTSGHLVLSIAAGVTLARLEANLPTGTRVIRLMPNTPALVGASATGFALGTSATREDAQLTQKLLASVGVVHELNESLLDAVTGLSGSGPAFVYLVIEALSDGGVAAGLPRDVATGLAAQTVLGAAKMVLQTRQHPGALKDMVTSPGGTTIEGVHQLEKAAVRAAFIQAVRSAAEKSKQLGQR